MIIGRSTNQFGISRDGKDAFHPFQVDWTHLIASFDELVIMNTGVYSLFALQAGRVHLALLLALDNSCTLPYLHMEISTKLYVAGYKNVKARSFLYSHNRTDIVACLTRQAVHPVCRAASIKGILDSARPTIIGREGLGIVATVIMTIVSHQVSSPIEGSNRIVGIETQSRGSAW